MKIIFEAKKNINSAILTRENGTKRGKKSLLWENIKIRVTKGQNNPKVKNEDISSNQNDSSRIMAFVLGCQFFLFQFFMPKYPTMYQ